MADRKTTVGFRILSRFCQCTSVVSTSFGVIVLAGWIFHVQRLKGFIPGQVAVKANTAICFVLIGLSLWLAVSGASKRISSMLPIVLSLTASLVGLLSLLECWKGWDLGIDQLLLKAGADDLPGSVRPGLMSPITAVDFFLLGIAIALLKLETRWARVLRSVLPAVAAIASLLGVLDFVLEPQNTHTHIAPLTALILLLISFAMLCARTDWGFGALLASSTVGGWLCRRLLPSAILIPVAIAWLRWQGQQVWLYSEWTGLAIMTVSAAGLLAGLTIWTAFVVDRAEAKREAAEESARAQRDRSEQELRESALYTRSLIEASLDPLVTISAEGKITDVNQATEKATGLSRDRLIGSDFSDYFTEPQKAREGYQQVFERGYVRDYPLAIRSACGKGMEVLYNATVFEGATGEVEGVFAAARDITERKRAEQALLVERQRFRDVLDKLPAYVVLLTPDYHVAFDNTVFRERFGESKGRPCYEFLFHRDSPCEICETYNVLKTGAPHRWKWTGPDGRHYDIFDFPFPDTDGSPMILEMGLDVTEREQAELALRESEQKFSTLADLVPQFVWMCTPDGLNVYFNRRWFEYTGLSEDESYGEGWNTPFHPDDKQAAWNAWNHATTTGETYRIESRLRAADGSYRWFLIRGTPTHDDAGNIVKWFGTCTDIDEMKGAEEEIRKLNRELEHRVQERTAELQVSEQSVRRKLESILSPEGDVSQLELRDLIDVPAVQSLFDLYHKRTKIPLFVVDLKGEVLASVGWQDICVKFHRAHPDTCANCKESDMELTRGVKPGEFRLYKCKNNMWDAVTPIMLGDQQIGNLFCGQFFFAEEPLDYATFKAQAKTYNFDEKEYRTALERAPRLTRMDVDTALGLFAKLAQMLSKLNYGSIKLARSVAETDRANAQLEAANKELEAFTYSVSHDLRAPLRHISGFSNLLAEEFADSLPPEAQHHVQRIREGTRRMGQLVDDLLNLGRVGRKELNLQVAGLRSIVDDVIQGLKPEIGDRQVEWRISDLPYVECDTALMQQVFQNLLSNALKFTRPRARSVIEIGQEQHEAESVVYIRDNGVGFSMKYADKLFGVFQRLHRAEDFEGTGVGLATVQRIIQKHGGRVWAEAELDKGARFYFTLGNSQKSEETGKTAAAGGKS